MFAELCVPPRSLCCVKVSPRPTAWFRLRLPVFFAKGVGLSLANPTRPVSIRLVIFLTLLLWGTEQNLCAATNNLFQQAVNSYQSGVYAEAAKEFRTTSADAPASGTLLNLGLSEWRRGRVGAALVAWEQARWIDPFDARARENLRYARQLTGVESPDLSWYERTSTWLPVNAWAWIAGGSLWLAISLAVLPGVFRWRRSAWAQALAALGLAGFLVSLPAHLGVLTRTRIGFVLQKNAPLRLTPTEEAEAVVKLSAGEPARAVRTRGNYVLVRTARGEGWIERNQFGLICPK
jgi:hypothetical protein